MVVSLHSSRGRVRMELDQPVTAAGERLCCGCRGKVATAPAVDVSAEADDAPVASTMLMLFCSTRCGPLHAALQRALTVSCFGMRLAGITLKHTAGWQCVAPHCLEERRLATW